MEGCSAAATGDEGDAVLGGGEPDVGEGLAGLEPGCWFVVHAVEDGVGGGVVVGVGDGQCADVAEVAGGDGGLWWVVGDGGVGDSGEWGAVVSGPGGEFAETGLAPVWLTTGIGWSGRLCGGIDCLKLDRGEPSEAGLASAAVVGGLDPGDDRQAELLAGGPAVPVQHVVLE